MNKNQRKKMIAPIIIAVLFIAMIAGGIAFYYWVGLVSGLPIVLFSVFYILPIVGIIIALIQRMREIKGGEEDEASKY